VEFPIDLRLRVALAEDLDFKIGGQQGNWLRGQLATGQAVPRDDRKIGDADQAGSKLEGALSSNYDSDSSRNYEVIEKRGDESSNDRLATVNVGRIADPVISPPDAYAPI
jgi:hypothetical protein